MNPVWTIEKKRDGGELTDGQIGDFVRRYTAGSIAEEQMSALAMAIFLQGMTTAETASLTRHMLESGTVLSWPDDGLLRVDKHSTGGIGDKVSLLLAPMLACCGLQVPMISGRGLGATGGTLDKLEAIDGFRTDLSLPELKQVVQDVGCVITGATPDLVPADRKLYALRDVTGTVPSIPLITASIMSKKLAEGLDALVLDVKFGSGGFMKTAEQARALANSLVTTGRSMGVTTTALLTDMNQPLGRTAGNAVEVLETIETLQGRGPSDLMEVTIALGAELLCSTNQASDTASANAQLQQTIDSGKAYERFERMVHAQGGAFEKQMQIAGSQEVVSQQSGYVSRIDTQELGRAIIALGGGRTKPGEKLDLTTGLQMQVRLGDRVEAGQPLLQVFAANDQCNEVRQQLLAAIEMTDEPPPANPLIL